MQTEALSSVCLWRKEFSSLRIRTDKAVPVHDPENHDHEWTPSRMDTIPNGHNPEWTQSQKETIPKGHHPEWTQSRMDTIPNEHLQLYSYFGV